MSVAQQSSELINTQLLDHAFRQIARAYDPRHGGFGSAPKFPSSMNLEFLLRTFRRTGDARALEMAVHTCRKMAEGGMYDQLGGGFHRYSTDARWLVPHFEKMLYDNALLSRLYLHVFQITGEDFFRRIVEETLDYVAREMTDASGAFYSTQDADSEGVEGKFFVWDRAEVETLLGAEDARLFCAYFGVTEGGNFEEKNILNVAQPASDVARESGVSEERLALAVARGRRILFGVREGRVKPGRDEKVITAWNGLMLESFAEAAAVLGREDYRAVAERNAEFISNSLTTGGLNCSTNVNSSTNSGLLLHVYKDGQAKHAGFLDDHAFVASALVTLYETTGDLRRLEAALRLVDRMIEEFWDEDEGGFFYNGRSGERLIVRQKDYFDNATPSGNSVAAETLLRLCALTGNEDYRRKATNVLRLVRDAVERYPSAFGYALGALDFYLSTPKEVALISPQGGTGEHTLAREVWSRYLPNKVVAQAFEDDEHAAELVPLLRERKAVGGRATAYVCENYTCQQPVSAPEELAAQLADAAGERRALAQDDA
jgi:uncharacterized protein